MSWRSATAQSVLGRLGRCRRGFLRQRQPSCSFSTRFRPAQDNAQSGPARLTLPRLPLFQSAVDTATRSPSKPAVSSQSCTYGYSQLLHDAAAFSSRLEQLLEPEAATTASHSPDLQQQRTVLFLVPPSYDHVVVQWGTWMAGAVAVPLQPGHADAELEFIAQDCGAVACVAHPQYAHRLQPVAERLKRPLLTIAAVAPVNATPPALTSDSVRWTALDAGRAALLIYTSGTTGRAKARRCSRIARPAQCCLLQGLTPPAACAAVC